MEEVHLDKFLGQSGSQNLCYSFLTIFNTCARHFSENSELRDVIVEFFELHYFDYLKMLLVSEQRPLVFRLVYSIQASLEALKQVSPNKIIEILLHLAAFLNDTQAPRHPEYLQELAYDTFRKVIASKELAKKVRLNIYSALDLFDMIPTTNSCRYLNLLDCLIQSAIGKDFGKYSTKILGLVIGRLEKLSVNSPPLEQSLRSQICRDVLHLVQSLLSTPGTLENEFCEIETELAKIFRFIQHSDTFYIVPEVLLLAQSVLQVAGTHIKMLDIVVQSIPAIYSEDVDQIIELYDLFYAYIRYDSNFVLNESTFANKLSIHAHRNPTAIQAEDSQASASQTTSPFQFVNRVLLHSLANSRHLRQDPFMRVMLLLILQHQRWNEAGLLVEFKQEIDLVFDLLRHAESQIDQFCLGGRVSVASWPESAVMVYVMSSVAVLNVFHYYYEDVVQVVIDSGFLQKFLRVGIPLFLEVYTSLPEPFQKIFKMCCIRIINCYKQLQLDLQQLKALLEIVAKVLSVELEFSVEHEEELFSKTFKFSKKSKYGTKAMVRFSSEEFEQSQRADIIRSVFTVMPVIKKEDFFVTGVDLYKYFKSTISEIKGNDSGFADFVRREMSPVTIAQLNDLMNSEMIRKTSVAGVGSSMSHINPSDANVLGFVPRKRAKIVPRSGQK